MRSGATHIIRSFDEADPAITKWQGWIRLISMKSIEKQFPSGTFSRDPEYEFLCPHGLQAGDFLEIVSEKSRIGWAQGNGEAYLVLNASAIPGTRGPNHYIGYLARC